MIFFKNLDLDEIAINEAIDGLLNISFSGFNNLSVQALDKIIPHQEEGLKCFSSFSFCSGVNQPSNL
jgi:hypothetical protein